MSAEQTSTKPRTASEDEDLFDFPVIEMKLEGEAEPRSPMPAAKPAAAEGGAGAVLGAHAPAAHASGAQAASATAAPSAAAATAASAAATTTATTASASKTSPVVTSTAAAAGTAAQPESPARTTQTLRPLLIGLAVFALINLVCMAFLWNASQSLQQGLEQLRHSAAQIPQAAPAQQTAQADAPVSTTPAQAPAPVLAPMESFDATALRLAREEIRTGNSGAARRRLAQLLAVIDRVDPQQRAGVEADALYLSAQALEAELQQRQGGKP